MPVSIGRDRVIELVADGAQLVETLPAHEYDEEHLPGAIHLPIKSLGPQVTAMTNASKAHGAAASRRTVGWPAASQSALPRV